MGTQHRVNIMIIMSITTRTGGEGEKSPRESRISLGEREAGMSRTPKKKA